MTGPRPSSYGLGLLAVLLAAVVATLADAALPRPATLERALQQEHLVRSLQLTDLCLFTEARYTRHLSQADLHSAFQDHPLAFEHFPSGSLVVPPAAVTRAHE
jgi:hypothetical protein